VSLVATKGEYRRYLFTNCRDPYAIAVEQVQVEEGRYLVLVLGEIWQPRFCKERSASKGSSKLIAATPSASRKGNRRAGLPCAPTPD